MTEGIGAAYIGTTCIFNTYHEKKNRLISNIRSLINSIELDVINIKNKDMETKNFTPSINIQGNVNGNVGNQSVNGDYINNYYANLETACKEAKLSNDDINELKKLINDKNKDGLVKKIESFGIHTSAIITGHLLLEGAKYCLGLA